jgi:hypothetical protein
MVMRWRRVREFYRPDGFANPVEFTPPGSRPVLGVNVRANPEVSVSPRERRIGWILRWGRDSRG